MQHIELSDDLRKKIDAIFVEYLGATITPDIQPKDIFVPSAKSLEKISLDLIAGVEIPEEITNFQQLTKEFIFSERPAADKFKQNIFHLFKDKPASEYTDVIGSLGQAIDFAQKLINIDHRSIADVQEGALAEGGKIYSRLKETVGLAAYMKENNITVMMDVVKSWFNRNHNKICKFLQKLPPQLIKDAEQREQFRLNANKPKSVDIARFEGESNSASKSDISSILSSFDVYRSGGKGMHENIKDIEYLEKKCEKIGLIHQKNSISATSNIMKQAAEDIYYDFSRIKMSDAAMIFFNQMNGVINNNQKSAVVLSDYFKTAFWRPDNKMSESSQRTLPFLARAYPISCCSFADDSYAGKLIKHLDNYPSIGGMPIFDQFWVIVPTIKVGGNDGLKNLFIPDDNNIKCCSVSSDTSNIETHQRYVDQYLIKSGQVFPIILGESLINRKCYFISYLI